MIFDFEKRGCNVNLVLDWLSKHMKLSCWSENFSEIHLWELHRDQYKSA